MPASLSTLVFQWHWHSMCFTYIFVYPLHPLQLEEFCLFCLLLCNLVPTGLSGSQSVFSKYLSNE